MSSTVTKFSNARPMPEIVTGKAKPKAPFMILAADLDWGKTTVAAHTRDPLLIMAKGETSYETLLSKGLVPEVPRMVCETWSDVMRVMEWLTEEDRGYKSVIFDALGGFEEMLFRHVCDKHYGGDWGEKGFASFQKGYTTSLPYWKELLAGIEQLTTSSVLVLCLGHLDVRTVNDPLVDPFDQWQVAMHHKLFAATARQADAILVGKFQSILKKEKGSHKAKGIGGRDRILLCQNSDAAIGKNKYNLPERLDMPNDPAKMWETIRNAMKG